MEPNTRVRGIGLIVLILGLMAGALNAIWLSNGRALPVYGIIVDALLAAICVAVIVRGVMVARNQPMADEFQVMKTRHATHLGFVVGLGLYSLASLWPYVHPDSYHALMSRIGGDDAFSMGRVAGMLPFVIGMCIGQVATWMKFG